MKQTKTRNRSHRDANSKGSGQMSNSPRSRRSGKENSFSKGTKPKRRRVDSARTDVQRFSDIKPNWMPDGSWAQDSSTVESKSKRNGNKPSWKNDSKPSRANTEEKKDHNTGKKRVQMKSNSTDFQTNRNRQENNSRRNNKSKGKFSGKKRAFDISKYESQGNEEHVVEKYVNSFAFADFDLHPALLERIAQKGYNNPTEIQDKAIQPAMTGRDVIGIAGTGTGKTATFLIPIIQELLINPVHNKALIIAPTRELATQIYDEFRDLTKGLNLYSTCLIGGNPVPKSIKELSRPNHMIIGTPGRLVDMSNRGHLKFGKFEKLVLDEFDRMLDMGFIDEVKDINAKMTNKKQTFLFSATMDKSIKSIVEHITNEPIQVMATAGIRPSNSIKQEVMYVPGDKKKIEFLTDIITDWQAQKILVFCTTKRKVDQVHKSLHSSRITTDLIHGDKSQRAREVALRKFKSGKINVLVATDVVARGIDVNDVSLVINYEIPHDYTDYIHRIGRTGRAGKLGKAITLID